MDGPTAFQRVEGAAIFVSATIIYFYNDLSWIFYLVLLFTFDIFMIGYAINRRVGAVVYNIGHSLIFPSLLVVVFMFAPGSILLGLICLWFAHVGIDRALGYGLKLSSGFKHTHLGYIGGK